MENFKIAVSGKYWVGEIAGSILDSVRTVINSAENELQITTYSLGENTEFFFDLLKNILDKRIRVQIIVNRFDSQSHIARSILRKLKKDYEYLTLYSFEPSNKLEDLHAKIIVVDRKKAIIGSSNISWHGYITNHELALVIDGEVIESIAGMIDTLVRSNATREIQS